MMKTLMRRVARSRRTAPLTAAAFIGSLAVVACTGAFAQARDARPNILFIAVDDLRPEMGCYGVEEIITPHMDALAERGVLFNRAYCQQAVCNPSRASLLTGLRPDSTRVWDLVTEFRDTIPDAVTLPQHFKRNGYYAVGMGKMFHNPFPDPASWTVPRQPRPKGYAWYSRAVTEDLRRRREEARAAGMTESEIGNRIRGPATDCEDVADSARHDGALCDLALEQLRIAAERDEPFFLGVGFILPHLPWTPPKKYWDMYDPNEIPMATNDFLPRGMPPVAFGDRSKGGMYELMDCMDFRNAPGPFEGTLTEEQKRRLKHGYYASVTFVDAQIGRLTAELEQLGIANDTIVVLWGDHGWKLGEHNGWCKQTNYEIDTRSPLLIVAPDAEGKGHPCDALVEFIDIYPTLCELADLPIPEELEGKSLVPLLHDPSRTVKAAALSQFPRKHEGRQYMGYAMRTDRYRLVEWVELDTNETAAVELYDEEADPEENENIAVDSRNAELVADLQRELWTHFERRAAGTVLRQPPKQPTRPELHIVNRRDERASVFWLAPDGRRVQVATIEPGGTNTQRTTLGHRFLIRGGPAGVEQEHTVHKQSETLTLESVANSTDDTVEDNRPNILFLMGDDWSYPHASAYGDPIVETPTFDRIAREGVLFNNAYVSAPSCTPSRLAVASGQYHFRLEEGASLGGSLRPDIPVYPEILQATGYSIGFCRKGAAPSRHEFTGRDPFGPRFDSFEDFYAGHDPNLPFCFWYGAGEPHRPYVFGTGAKAGLAADEVRVPACLPDNETTRNDLCDYYERVQAFDRYAEEILALLENSGELDDTVIVMSGDNGLPFPRCKATLYDTGTRVPLAIRWGNHINAGRTVDDFVTLCDLAPTFLGAAGIEAPDVMTGRTLIPILASRKRGQVEPSRDHVLTAIERHVFDNPCRAIRTADYLYILNFAPETWRTGEGSGHAPTYDFTYRHWPSGAEAFSFNVDPSPTKQFMLHSPNDPTVGRLYGLAFGVRPEEELYNLKNDPDQLHNVADDPQYAPIREQLRRRLEQELLEYGDPRMVE